MVTDVTKAARRQGLVEDRSVRNNLAEDHEEEEQHEEDEDEEGQEEELENTNNAREAEKGIGEEDNDVEGEEDDDVEERDDNAGEGEQDNAAERDAQVREARKKQRAILKVSKLDPCCAFIPIIAASVKKANYMFMFASFQADV